LQRYFGIGKALAEFGKAISKSGERAGTASG
jgi:hypothetical protein